MEARSVYDSIAEAEAKAHGLPVSDVHYHEVGALDAVADVTNVCLALRLLAPERIVASPIAVGSGTVMCAHGEVPVPAPATANLLHKIPTFGGDVEGELCTPTGAALVAHFATAYGPQPAMATEAVGTGIGTRDFGRPNVLRAFIGESADRPVSAPVTSTPGSHPGVGTLAEIVCNVDDMTPEELSFACERILAGKALDAYVVPGTMKKGRSAHELKALCDPADADEVAADVLR